MSEMDTPDDAAELRALASGLRAHLRRAPTASRVAAPPPRPPLAAAPEPAPARAAPAPRPLATHPGASLPLADVRAELGECTRCKLHSTRKNIVFGVGNPDAELVFIGEAPGANEDLQGEPFVGEAGQLLTRMIEAMGFARQDVYIANIIKCRPPGNRNPEPDEIEACEPFLKKQLAALRPRVIVALGKFAAQWLTGSKPDAAIGALRGRWHVYEGVKVMPTYHPAYLLRTPGQKRVVWEDLKLVMAELRDAKVPGEPHAPASD
jgi:DNA polymerase